MFEIPGRTMQQPQSFLAVKHPSDSQAEELETSYKPPLKQMKILNCSKQKKVFEKIQSTVSTVQAADAAQPKSKEKNVKTKKKQTGKIICDQDATVSTPIKMEPTYLRKETDSKKHTAGKIICDQDATVSTPIKMEPTYLRKETDSKKHTEIQAKTFEVVIFSELKRKPKICYGCKKPLIDEKSLDLILKTQDVRDYFGQCGQKHRAFKSSNVYLHLLEKCVQKKYGKYQHNYILPEKMRAHLNSAQSTMLQSMNIIQDPGAIKYTSKTEKCHFKHVKTEQYKTEEEEISSSSHSSRSTLSR
ncbi:uncharacterized protein LOC116983301 [Amblyraja radiata]|uniref:uncharacterized protein LOC116983301 n=1 Tax=Amblyraja radiata TaxID=386614 RepID=UPI0014023268|nr:uncharacterized protein LOC116983301 [Amblyraja radiata]